MAAEIEFGDILPWLAGGAGLAAFAGADPDPAGLDWANKMTRRDRAAALKESASGRADIAGIYKQQQEGMKRSLAESTGALGASTAAGAQDLRDQMASFIGQLMAQKGGGLLDPAGLMAASTRETVKGLRSLYGQAGQVRSANIINTEAMNQQALARLGEGILGTRRGAQEVYASTQYHVGPSEQESIGGALGGAFGLIAGLS